MCYSKLGDPQAALKFLEFSASTAPDDFDYQLGALFGLEDVGLIPEAIERATRILENSNTPAPLQLGAVTIIFRGTTDAEPELRRRSAMQAIDAVSRLSNRLKDFGPMEQLASEVMPALEAESYNRVGEYEKAEELFQSLLRKNPSHAAALMGLAQLRYENKPHEAAALMKRAVEAGAVGIVAPLYYLAHYSLRNGDWPAAISFATQGLGVCAR